MILTMYAPQLDGAVLQFYDRNNGAMQFRIGDWIKLSEHEPAAYGRITFVMCDTVGCRLVCAMLEDIEGAIAAGDPISVSADEERMLELAYPEFR